jgi:hypothetical protein
MNGQTSTRAASAKSEASINKSARCAPVSASQTNWLSRSWQRLTGQSQRDNLPTSFLMIDWTGVLLVVTEIRQSHQQLTAGRTFKNQFDLNDPAGVDAASAWLGQLVTQHALPAQTAIVAAPRRFVAFKLLTLPSLADDRLADAVALQSEALFPLAAPELVVDYIAQPPMTADGRRSILVAAMPRQQVTRIQSCLAGAKLQCLGILVSDLGLAYVDADDAANQGTQAVIALNQSKIEYVITSQGVPVLCYAAKSPPVESLAADIVSTLRRLMASIPSWAMNGSLDRVQLVGVHPPHLPSELHRTIGSKVTARQPLTHDDALKAAALVAAYNHPECRIDFLNNRRPLDHHRLRIWQRAKWAAVAAAVLMVMYAMSTLYAGRLESRIVQLQAQEQKLQTRVEARRAVWESVAAVSRWQESQIDYSQTLMAYIASLPKTQDIVLTRLEVSQDVDGLQTIDVDGLARETTCVNELVNKLIESPEYHQTQLRRLELKTGDNRYNADFALSVSIAGGTTHGQ